MRDPRKEKSRDLRRISRSGGHNPSIFDLFDKYHPEIKKLEEESRLRYRAEKRRLWYYFSPEWHYYHDCKYEWATKIAGYWDAIGGSAPAWYRRMKNRIRRAKLKAALSKAIQNDDLEDFVLPHYRRNIRWEWF